MRRLAPEEHHCAMCRESTTQVTQLKSGIIFHRCDAHRVPTSLEHDRARVMMLWLTADFNPHDIVFCGTPQEWEDLNTVQEVEET